jgi:hypothetical protein
MKFTLILLFAGIYCIAQCQLSFNHYHGSSALSIGNAYAHITGVQSIYGNPANLCSVEGWAVNISALNQYEIPELTSFQSGIMYGDPKLGHFGFSIFQLGTTDYRDQKFLAAYARNIGRKINLGIASSFMHTQMNGYQDIDRLTLEIGAVYEIMSNIKFAIHLFNPLIRQYSKDQIIPVIMTAGLLFSMGSQADLFLEFEKNIYKPVFMKFGLKYKPTERFHIGAGFFTTDGYPNITAGIQYLQTSKISFGFGISYHQYLGISSTIGIDYYLRSFK